jgi:hypothetical protein
MSNKSLQIAMACSRHLAALSILLSSCSAPFEKEVTKWLLKKDSSFVELDDISVIEKMTEEETQVYYEVRIEEERARLLEQYKLRSCEPCVIGRPGKRVVYTIADLKAESIDSVLFPKRSFLRDSSGRYHCDISLFEKKALQDSANRGLIRKNEITIGYLTRMLKIRPCFYHLNVNFVNNKNSPSKCYVVARVTAYDTVFTKTELSLSEFLSPHKYPHPQFEKKNEKLVAASLSQMDAAGGGLLILKQKPIGRTINENDYLPWDSIAFYEFEENPNYSHVFHEGIYAVVDTSQVVRLQEGKQLRPSYPIFIYNLTDQASSFSIFCTQQAKDSLGRWRAIEGVNGIPYEGTPSFVLRPGQVGIVKVQLYEGDYKTKLRTKLTAEFGNGTPFVFFTEEYSGTINYGQFTPPQDRHANRTLEEDHHPWFEKYWQVKTRESIRLLTNQHLPD